MVKRLLLFIVLLFHASEAFSVSETRVTPLVRVVREISPAVVNINTEQTVYTKSNPFGSFYGSTFDDLFESFFEQYQPDLRKENVPLSLGSGVIIDKAGHVLTNEHVVVRASRIHVTVIQGRGSSFKKMRYEAKMVGADPSSDIAVLKIQGKGPFPYATMGTTNDLEIGETVVAFGNPLGLESSVTSGIISQVSRRLRIKNHDYFDLVQTSALINPGNSGGPLVNLDGQVIGINTAIVDVREAQGLSFAIPIDKAKRIVKDLIEYGKVSQSWVGMRVQELSEVLREQARVPAEEGGVIVTQIERGSPAEGAGLQERDVITFIDETSVASRTIYWDKIREYSPLKTFNIIFWRSGRKLQAKIVTAPFPSLYGERLGWERLGVRVKPLSSSLRRQYGVLADSGMVIVEVDGNGALGARGVRPGDLLIGVNQLQVHQLDDFNHAMIGIMGANFASLIIQRGRYGYLLNVEL